MDALRLRGRQAAEWLAAVERHDRLSRAVLLAFVAAIVAALWIRLAVNPTGDLQNHREFALRLLTGRDLYTGGLDVPYMPFWAAAHIPAALLPARIMPAALFPFGVAACAILVWLLDRLCRDMLPVENRTAFWVAVGAVALTSRFLLRDLLDAGQNVEIVALTWAGIFLWSRDRWRLAGVCLGLAIALKLTALAFVAYFAWKREWRFAAWSLSAAVLFSLTPALWMGWSAFGHHLQIWAGTLSAAMRQTDPRVGVLGLETVQNISIRPALIRFLMHIPEGVDGQGRFSHPLNIDVLTLPASSAAALARVAIGGIVLTAMWMTRKPLDRSRDFRAIWECAGVSVIAMLLSPITWRAHAVAVLPALYLVLRSGAAGLPIRRSAQIAVLMLILSSLVLSRGIAGPTVSGLVHAYYLFTWTFLVLAISMWRSAGTEDADACAAAAA